MKKVAIFLWWLTIMILFTGFYGFYLMGAITLVIGVFWAIFGRKISRYYERKREDKLITDMGEAMSSSDERSVGLYEMKRREFLELYGREPSFEETHRKKVEAIRTKYTEEELLKVIHKAKTMCCYPLYGPPVL